VGAKGWHAITKESCVSFCYLADLPRTRRGNSLLTAVLGANLHTFTATGELLLGAALLSGQPLYASFGGQEAPAVLRCRGACASLSCFVPPAQLPHSHTVKLCLTLGDGRTVSQLLDFEYVARLVPEPGAGVVPSGAQGGWHAAPGSSAAAAGAQQAGQAEQQGPALECGSGSWQAPAAAAALTAAGVGGALAQDEGVEDEVGSSAHQADEVTA